MRTAPQVAVVTLLIVLPTPARASVVDAAAGGYAPGGLDALAPVVDMVLGTQVARLKRPIDTGRPE